MTRRGVGRVRTSAVGGALLVALAATAAAETTYASTVAAGSASTSRRAADVPGARLTAHAGADGVVVDRLSIDFASPRVGEIRPCVVWTGGASARIDLTDVAWDPERAVGARASSPADADAAPLAKYVAEMAWSSGVAGQVPNLAGPGAFKSADVAFDAVSSPEPGAAALFALGAAGLGVVAWTRRRRAAPR